MLKPLTIKHIPTIHQIFFALFCLYGMGDAWAQPAATGKVPLKNWKVNVELGKAQVEKTRVRANAVVASATALSFVPVPPCRVVDTRSGQGFTGAFGPPALTAGQPRIIIVPQSNCGVPPAAAYSLNLAVVPPPSGAVGYLTAWPADQSMPATAVLNDPQGGVVNQTAIVSASINGGILVQATDNTDLVIDINGYFVAPNPGLQFRGAWSSAAVYAVNDVVIRDSFNVTSSYISLSPNQGVEPAKDVTTSAPHWAILAQGGAVGPQGSPGPQGSQGPAGPQGPLGAQGPSGVLAFYGDGSDGPLVISSPTDWTANPPSGMLQFSSLTITGGGSLTVPSGLVIRVTGNVSISGSLIVAPTSTFVGGPLGGSCVPAAFVLAPVFGSGAKAMSPLVARTLFKTSNVGYGLATGGGLTILAAGSIVINSGGSISAAGPPGGVFSPQSLFSAGAGGIIILASRTSIFNAGTLAARGGNGANGNASPGGGGGGGGIVHLLAPSVAVGNVDVSGGLAGSPGAAQNPSGSPVPGGACGGDGGASSFATGVGSPGGTGQFITTIVTEPTSLFVP
jgi:hypothetical protein